MWLRGGPRMRMCSVIMRVCELGVCVYFWVELWCSSAHPFMRVCVLAYLCTCVIFPCVMCDCVYVRAFMYVCMYVCLYVCMYV